MTIRAGCYLRISTAQQSEDLQRDALEAVARQRGWDAGFHVETGSGSGAKALPVRAELMRQAERGQLDVVAVWRFDRFARSTRDLIDALDSLARWNVAFVSITEGIDTTTPAGRLVFTIVAAMGEFERTLIVERVRAGIAARRRRGLPLGRPPRAVDVHKAERLLARGLPFAAVARKMQLPRRTLERAIARWQSTQEAVKAAKEKRT